MLNCKADDVDSKCKRLTNEGHPVAMPLEDHPWGDCGFSVIDTIGKAVYVYSERDLFDEFKQYFKR